MSKKQLDTTDIANELKSGSVFFKKETDEKPENTEERTENRSEIRSEIRTEKRTVLLPIKRRTKRYSFEFYEDQLSRIKTIKIETELAGENISQSEIVREALDHYFESVRKTERSEERTEIRTGKKTGLTIDLKFALLSLGHSMTNGGRRKLPLFAGNGFEYYLRRG